MSDVMPGVSMAAFRVVWDQPGYRYSYYAGVCGRGRKWLTLRRQLRGLNREIADWYRHWKVPGQTSTLLNDVYVVVVSRIHACSVEDLYSEGYNRFE